MSIRTSRPVRCLVVACGLLLCGAASAQAQRTLSHANALAGLGGCDAPGYPLTICRPGSYKLISDLRVPSDSSGVLIQVSLVTLDLNGFSIYQGGSCGAGAGTGVDSSPALTSVTVRNGTVSCHGRDGIRLLGGKHVVEKLTAIANKGRGIAIGEQSAVRNSNATQNGEHGIFALPGCNISGNGAHANGFDGIVAAVGSSVLGNTARANGRYGLLLTGAGYGTNVLTGNAGDFENPNTQVVGGTQMGHNICNGGPCS